MPLSIKIANFRPFSVRRSGDAARSHHLLVQWLAWLLLVCLSNLVALYALYRWEGFVNLFDVCILLWLQIPIVILLLVVGKKDSYYSSDRYFYWIAMIIPSIWTLILNLITLTFYDISLSAAMFDVFAILFITLPIFILQKNTKTALILSILVATILSAISSIHLFVFSRYIRYNDFFLLFDVIRIFPSIVLVLFGAVSILLLGIFFRNFNSPGLKHSLALLPFALSILVIPLSSSNAALSLVMQAPLLLSVPHHKYGHYVGPFLDMLLYQKQKLWYRDLVGEASASSDHFLGRTLPPLPPRNIYLTVVESLFDPTQLQNVSLSPDPLSPLFQEWRRGPRSTALSPEFGGRSANAEFEVLCGVPAALATGQVLFLNLRQEKIDCLPRKLRNQGWSTSVSTPISKDFFNGDDAYRRIGFAERWFDRDYDMSDRDGNWLAPGSQAQQEIEKVKIQLAEGKPFLRYIVFAANHFPFEMNTAARPPQIEVVPQSPLLSRFANSVFYMTHAVQTYVEAVQDLDPEALIVVVGDHLPQIGESMEELRSQLVDRHPEYPAKYDPKLYETPLIVLDRGRRHAVGQLPHFLIPEVIADILSDGRFCQENRCLHQDDVIIRPVSGGILIFDQRDNEFNVCEIADTIPRDRCKNLREMVLRMQATVFGLIN